MHVEEVTGGLEFGFAEVDKRFKGGLIIAFFDVPSRIMNFRIDGERCYCELTWEIRHKRGRGYRG